MTNHTLNIQLANELCDALESGNWQQGQGFLQRVENTFCCLGVLCDITKERVGGVWINDHRQLTFHVGSDNMRYYLPSAVADLIGLTHNGEYKHNGQLYVWHENEDTLYTSLAVMNDEGISHYDIAQAIRRLIALIEGEQRGNG